MKNRANLWMSIPRLILLIILLVLFVINLAAIADQGLERLIPFVTPEINGWKMAEKPSTKSDSKISEASAKYTNGNNSLTITLTEGDKEKCQSILRTQKEIGEGTIFVGRRVKADTGEVINFKIIPLTLQGYKASGFIEDNKGGHSVLNINIIDRFFLRIECWGKIEIKELIEIAKKIDLNKIARIPHYGSP